MFVQFIVDTMAKDWTWPVKLTTQIKRYLDAGAESIKISIMRWDNEGNSMPGDDEISKGYDWEGVCSMTPSNLWQLLTSPRVFIDTHVFNTHIAPTLEEARWLNIVLVAADACQECVQLKEDLTVVYMGNADDARIIQGVFAANPLYKDEEISITFAEAL